MKKSVLLAALLAACCVTNNDVPVLAEKAAVEHKAIVEPEFYVNQPYTIRVEFKLFRDEVISYPKVAQGFMNAIAEWSKHLPIEAMVVVDTPRTLPWLPNPVTDRLGLIDVHLEDIQKRRGLSSTHYVGVWFHNKKELLLDADLLAGNLDLATHVAMHELGHVFGLPHVLQQGILGAFTGDITVPETMSAQDFLMYPSVSPNDLSLTPAELEIKLARNYVLYQMTGPQHRWGQNRFCEY